MLGCSYVSPVIDVQNGTPSLTRSLRAAVLVLIPYCSCFFLTFRTVHSPKVSRNKKYRFTRLATQNMHHYVRDPVPDDLLAALIHCTVTIQTRSANMIQERRAIMVYSWRLSLDILGSPVQSQIEALGCFQSTVCLFRMPSFLVKEPLCCFSRSQRNPYQKPPSVSDTPLTLDLPDFCLCRISCVLGLFGII